MDTAAQKSPIKTIRKKCLDCTETRTQVKNCEITTCALHAYRMGKNIFYGKEKPESYRSPLKAIRAECLDCAKSAHEVRLCPATECTLWHYRFGKYPKAKNMADIIAVDVA